MIRACRCAPRLTGRRRTTSGGLRDSDEGPGAGEANAQAASRTARAMQQPRVLVHIKHNKHALWHCMHLTGLTERTGLTGAVLAAAGLTEPGQARRRLFVQLQPGHMPV